MNLTKPEFTMLNLQNVTRWQHPQHYAGYSPDGDFLVASVHRDSDSVSRSNYICAKARLETVAATLPPAAQEPPAPSPDEARPAADDPRAEAWVFEFRASHCLVGWVDYLLVRADAPPALVQAVVEIADALEGHPVLDEDHLSELEFDEACTYWADMSVADRLDAIERSACRGVSIFAARRPELPSDDTGALLEHLRG